MSGLYFAVWITEQDAPDWNLATAGFAAMFIVAILGPWIGARTDHSGRRMPILVWGTLVTIAATSLLGTPGLVPSLLLYAVALVAFNLAGISYDALLPDVAAPDQIGRISGIGVGVGYVGSFVAVVLGAVVDGLGWEYSTVFPLIAASFLLFALPSFFLVVERPRPARSDDPPALRSVLRHLWESWGRARKVPGVARFLVGRFIYTDAINTLTGGFLAIFATRELGYSAEDVRNLLTASIVAAIFGGLLASRLVDRVGPRRYLHAMLYLWMVAMATGIAIAVTKWTAPMCWPGTEACMPIEAAVIGGIGGIALAGLWTADRPYMAALSPPELHGEFYGLYGTVGRFATFFGLAVWGILDLLSLPRIVLMSTLIVALIISRVVLGKVPRVAGT